MIIVGSDTDAINSFDMYTSQKKFGNFILVNCLCSLLIPVGVVLYIMGKSD